MKSAEGPLWQHPAFAPNTCVPTAFTADAEVNADKETAAGTHCPILLVQTISFASTLQRAPPAVLKFLGLWEELFGWGFVGIFLLHRQNWKSQFHSSSCKALHEATLAKHSPLSKTRSPSTGAAQGFLVPTLLWRRGQVGQRASRRRNCWNPH